MQLPHYLNLEHYGTLTQEKADVIERGKAKFGCRFLFILLKKLTLVTCTYINYIVKWFILFQYFSLFLGHWHTLDSIKMSMALEILINKKKTLHRIARELSIIFGKRKVWNLETWLLHCFLLARIIFFKDCVRTLTQNTHHWIPSFSKSSSVQKKINLFYC